MTWLWQSKKKRLFVNIDDLLESNENGKYTYLNPLEIEIGCKPILTLTMDDSPLKGLYEAGQMISVEGAVEVEFGKTVIFNAPLLKISSLLDANSTSIIIIIKPDGCN
jgi:hypothetical protein